jgi:8-oxo-dGDP phosphatase
MEFTGSVWSVARDDVSLPGGFTTTRDVVIHPGAVGVAALDGDDRILLIRQFRHPVSGYLLELPAGLRDAPGEPPVETARRELAEEAGIQATEWHVLVDFFNSPGGSTEAFRCFLARGLSDVPGGRLVTGEAEEADLPRVWVPLDEAVEAVLSGDLHNPTTVTGVLAAAAARRLGWRTLRPAEGPMWDLSPDGR